MAAFVAILIFIKKRCGGEDFPGCHTDVIVVVE
jgi:hypothetical protein